MNVSHRSEQNSGEGVSDAIRVASIAIASYEYVWSMMKQVYMDLLICVSSTTAIFSPCLRSGGFGSPSSGETK